MRRATLPRMTEKVNAGCDQTVDKNGMSTLTLAAFSAGLRNMSTCSL